MSKKKGGAGGGPLAITGPDLSASPARSSNQGAAAEAEADPAAIAAKDTEIGRLNMLVKQRDNEIGILLNYLNKQKASGGDTSLPVEGMINTTAGSSTQYSQSSSQPVAAQEEETK